MQSYTSESRFSYKKYCHELHTTLLSVIPRKIAQKLVLSPFFCLAFGHSQGGRLELKMHSLAENAPPNVRNFQTLFSAPVQL